MNMEQVFLIAMLMVALMASFVIMYQELLERRADRCVYPAAKTVYQVIHQEVLKRRKSGRCCCFSWIVCQRCMLIQAVAEMHEGRD